MPDVNVTADRDVCIGTGECWRIAPEAFDTDEDGIVIVLDTATGVDTDTLRRAERGCPVGAIVVTSD
jgi:ferredoxin